jgi:2,5-diamino-6-(ribosylamino)-4(3H)-pyrimidinone 5'-phosphate reductase
MIAGNTGIPGGEPLYPKRMIALAEEGTILPASGTRPHVLMMSEITADGKLTLKKGASSKILMKYMSHETEILLHETRAACDAIMVGSNTIRIDNSFLTVRFVPGKSPLRVIPNSRADISLDSNIFLPGAPTVIAVSGIAPRERVEAIRCLGADVVVAGKEQLDLPELMHILREQYDVRRMMIEGGPTLNWHMLHARLVDEIRLIHLPFIVGGADTPSLVGGMHIDSENEMIRLSLKKFYLCGTNLVTEYDVLYENKAR